MVVFGAGLAITVAPLTSTALAAAPAAHAGVASAVNNATARAGGLLAVAILPAIAGITGTTYLHPTELASGFRTAMLVAAAWSLLGGVAAAVGIRDPHRAPEGRPSTGAPAPCLACSLEATQLSADR